MSKTKSKALSAVLSVTTTIWLSGAVMLLPVAHGQTPADLQAQITALLAQIAALQAQLGGGASVAAAACNFTRALTVGSTGSDVMCLQKYLNGAGFKVSVTGAGSPGNESSYFGAKTKAAVAAWQAANGVAPAVGYFGSISRAKYVAVAGSVVVTPTPGTTPVPGTNLSLMVASDNPMSATVPKGASAVSVLKFNVMGNGVLNGLTFKRTGIGANSDVSNVYLYEGATRLTSGRSINSTTNEVSFINLALSVSGTRTLWLAIDVASAATAGNEHTFQLSASDGTPSISGTLMGNVMKIGGQTSGVATTTIVASALSSSTVGASNVQVAEFKITVSGAEDINVESIAMTQGGSISNANLSSFVLKQNDVTVATAASIGAKDLVTLVLASPLKIEKGQNKTFKLYANVAGTARSGDQIKMYFDASSDIKAKGLTYGFNIMNDISNLDSSSEAQTVELKGGDVTITFNGPISGDVAVNATDVELFNFTIATKNSIEIRNWRVDASTTNLISGEGFNDLKIWDTSNNSVVTSAVDISGNVTSTNQVFTDVFTMAAGTSKTFKITADIDPQNDNGDTITVKLAAFGASDIKNLDNNQFVATGAIVPSTNISGNQHTVQTPALEVQLSSDPSSQTLVQGSANKNLVGISLRATADTVKVSSIKIKASSTTGTLTSGEVTNLKLYDGDTQIGDTKSLDSSDLTATFNGLNLSIAKGETKTLVVKGSISNDMTDTDVFVVKISDITTDVSAVDSNGNTVTPSGTNPNGVQTVLVTVTTVGNVTVVKAADNSDSEAGLVMAGQEVILANFKFDTTNEDMTVNKLHILVSSSTSQTATTTATTDDVTAIKLFVGSTQIGATSGYSVQASGASSSIAIVENLGMVITKDVSKVLTVKGVIPAIGQSGSGADFGTNLYAHIMAAGFEAQGQTAKDVSISAASGNQKIVYKTKPTLSVSGSGLDTLGVGSKKIIKFTVAANGSGQVAWKKVQLKISVTGASITAATSANVFIRRTTGSQTNLTLASAFMATSETGATSTQTLDPQNGTTGYLTIVLSSAEEIAAGSSQEYVVLADVSGIVGGTATAAVSTNLHRAETTATTGTYGDIALTSGAHDASDSFVWSDYSVSAHTELTADWANSVLVQQLPSDSVTITR